MDRRHQTWATSGRFVPKTFVQPFVQFTRIEASSGIVLLAAAAAGLILANSAWSETYFEILATHLTVELGGFHFDETVLDLVNDGLMAVFFYVVGLEIKRQLVLGDLRDRRVAAVPVVAALGGMALPALIYLTLTLGEGGEAVRGWGIPMATDIAFALGVLALLGPRVPPAAKVFLLALAIADDIGAITVIAVFYTEDLDLGYLTLALAGLAAVWVASRVHIRSLAFYVPAALVIWYFTLESGVHATLAGVALGFLTPATRMYTPAEFDFRARAILDSYPSDVDDPESRERADHEAILLSQVSTEAVSPLSRVEHALQAWSSFLVIPLFALANAGVDFRGFDLSESAPNVALGVAAGLIIGKTVGISLFTFAAVRLGLGPLPAGTSWPQVIGLGAVGGIGFTVSLFVAGLAFTDPGLLDLAKIGVFAGSILAGIIGWVILSRVEGPARG
ncbi:MAG TPA: Na+/H+ antiporter NhaA [Acidimicrobiia bacterium]|jgi:NhaA family Na+:H+ antiporter